MNSTDKVGEDLEMEDLENEESEGRERRSIIKCTNSLFGLPEEIQPVVIDGKLMLQDATLDTHGRMPRISKTFPII